MAKNHTAVFLYKGKKITAINMIAVQFVEKVCIYKNRANSLSLSPNPFPSVKGSVCLVGSASCRAFGHTRPASVPGLSVGLPPSPRLGLRPKPHFQKLYRFIDRLKPPLHTRNGGFSSYYTFLKISLFVCGTLINTTAPITVNTISGSIYAPL